MKVVLDAPVGGLGDGLLYSTLPELYSLTRGDTVYISERTRARNGEVEQLLYGNNPFIKGVLRMEEADLVIGSPIAGASFVRDSRFLSSRMSPISLIEELHGFGKRTVLELSNGRPKIYYKPQLLTKYKSTIVVDPYSHSQRIPGVQFDRFFDRMRFDRGKAIVVQSRFSGPHGNDSLATLPRHNLANIFELIDMIFSCESFVCTESGSQVLAAAIRRHKIYTIFTTMAYNSKFFVFPGVNYNVTGKLTDDYLHNDENGEGLFV